jgi:putative membrane protein
MEHRDLGHPRTLREYLRLFLTGFAMGTADIIPGVSGGTMAFILGIYATLLNAIKSINLKALALLSRLQFRELLSHVSFFFLLSVFLGIGAAIVTLSNLLGRALEEYPTFVFAFFGGLVLASIVAISSRVRWNAGTLGAVVVGAVVAFIIVGLPELQQADHSLPVLFVSGMIAICAMILPGISGAFILLILGQYQFVLNAVRTLDILSLLAVGLGAVVGLLGFSRILSWLLKHHEHVTVAALIGFMLGSLRRIWIEASTGTARIETVDLGVVALIAVLFGIGFLVVSFLDHLQSRANPVMALVWRPRAAEGE